MKLIAKKPCSFGGKKFYIGDEIPVESVLNPQAQEKMGVLAIVADNATVAAPAEPTLPVVIHAEEGDLTLNLTADGLQAVADALRSNADDAVIIVNQMVEADALGVLYYLDGRATVKKAAEARAKAIDAEESAGDQ